MSMIFVLACELLLTRHVYCIFCGHEAATKQRRIAQVYPGPAQAHRRVRGPFCVRRGPRVHPREVPGHFQESGQVVSGWTDSAADPIACLIAGAEAIKRQTGSRPQTILLHADMPARFLEHAIASLRSAQDILGVGINPFGRQRTDGILWSLRGGRRNKKRDLYLSELEALPAQIEQWQRVVDRIRNDAAAPINLDSFKGFVCPS